MTKRADVERGRALVTVALAVVMGALGSFAWAHATLVFGTVTIDPSPARANAPTVMTLTMNDPAGTPTEDAVVRVEVAVNDGDVPVVSAPFVETSPGRYVATVTFPEDGTWTLLFRDTTFRQEEARAVVTLRVGLDGDASPPAFIFPPTATGPRSIGTWLAWLIGLPLAAAAIVTIMVLRQPPGPDGGDAAESSGEGDHRPERVRVGPPDQPGP